MPTNQQTMVNNLCQQLISLAIQRCRLSGVPCRLSVVFRQSTISDRHVTHISISDTGVGSGLKEFQNLNYSYNRLSAPEWDGLLTVKTTGIQDTELYNYDLNLKENASGRRLVKLPSTTKNNAIFSGTELSISIAEDMEVLLADMTTFLRKVLVLKTQNVAIELLAVCIDQQGLQCENVILATELESPSLEPSNVEQLASGLQDYVYKHGNRLGDKCLSCFSSRDDLKLGHGIACLEKSLNDTVVVEAAIIISETSAPLAQSCLKAFESKTEVLHFRDFCACSIHQSALKALRSIKWINYGLTLRNIEDDESTVSLEWENLPPNSHIDLVLHCYNKQYPPQLTDCLIVRQRIKIEIKLMKEAITLALDDLKEKHSGALLSARAVKIHSYAPDLARSIASLILSSDDRHFRGECLGLLGMQMGNIEANSVEECIKQKIVSAIDVNDRKGPGKHVEEVPYLFGDEHIQEVEHMWDECKEGDEDSCTFMDI